MEQREGCKEAEQGYLDWETGNQVNVQNFEKRKFEKKTGPVVLKTTQNVNKRETRKGPWRLVMAPWRLLMLSVEPGLLGGGNRASRMSSGR
jgi:hypothetical protein